MSPVMSKAIMATLPVSGWITVCIKSKNEGNEVRVQVRFGNRALPDLTHPVPRSERFIVNSWKWRWSLRQSVWRHIKRVYNVHRGRSVCVKGSAPDNSLVKRLTAVTTSPTARNRRTHEVPPCQCGRTPEQRFWRTQSLRQLLEDICERKRLDWSWGYLSRVLVGSALLSPGESGLGVKDHERWPIKVLLCCDAETTKEEIAKVRRSVGMKESVKWLAGAEPTTAVHVLYGRWRNP